MSEPEPKRRRLSQSAAEVKSAWPGPADLSGHIWSNVYNGGVQSIMMEIGYRTKLFQSACGGKSLTSQELADLAKCNERYVREWLGCMVCAKLFVYDADSGKYSIDPHLDKLIQETGTSMLSWSEMVSSFALNVDKYVEVFQKGGGVPAQHHLKFFDVLHRGHVENLQYDAIMLRMLNIVAGMAERLGDKDKPATVVEIGCGTGTLLNVYAKAFPAAKFYGYDLLESHVKTAQEQAAQLRLNNVHYAVKDVTELQKEEEGTADLVLSNDVLHDLPHPLPVVKAIVRLLRDDGVFLARDIEGSARLENNMGSSMNAMWYGVSTMHCMTISLANGGEGLGAMWGRETAQQLLKSAGFASVEHSTPDGDAVYVCRKQQQQQQLPKQ